MYESLLTVNSFYWGPDGEFRPALALDPAGRTGAAPARVEGRFALGSVAPDGSVMLVRDRLGLNKLFVAVSETGAVLAASYLIDLVRRGIPFESIHSVPPGHVVRVGPGRVIRLHRYRDVNESSAPSGIAVDDVARAIRTQLDSWFGRLAGQFAARKIRICLSGGLDSGIVAAFARKYFADVTAYTYAFTEPGTAPSEDAACATRLADALGIPLRCVPASARDVLAVIEDALCYGQDWRDFNVHCAVVNELLARAIRRDDDDDPADADSLVLTGDLANELLADYTPVTYGRHEFYALPDVGAARLRSALVRGLDAGDREVGIFARHGLDVIQPYCLLADEYLRLPATSLERDGIKQEISKTVAGDLLPGFVFDRIKVRAQIGNSTQPTGILPVLLDHGYDAPWLRSTFCRLFDIRREAVLNGFIRGGRYRVVNRSLDGAINDSVAV